MRGIILILALTIYITSAAESFLHAELEDDTEAEIADWSDVKTDGKIRLITFLIGIDSAMTRYYNYDEARIRSAMIVLMHTVNQYFYPLNIRLSIIDILPVKGTNMGLDDFISWKKEQQNLIEHDVTVLLRHNYEGGIAYSNGICSKNSLMISGFLPDATMNNAWVFMHQLAHVIGLTHKQQTKCECNTAINGRCLKLSGFPECSVQEMVDKLSNSSCLIQESPSFAKNTVVPKKGSLPVCGNGLQEDEEECDCGPERFCDNILCDAVKCRFIVQKAYLTTFIPLGFAFIAFVILLFGKYCLCSLFASLRNTGHREQMEKNRGDIENLNDVDVEQAPVRMRVSRNEEPTIPVENRRTRLSDLYVTMRPISRFWEKFHKQKDGSVAPI